MEGRGTDPHWFVYYSIIYMLHLVHRIWDFCHLSIIEIEVSQTCYGSICSHNTIAQVHKTLPSEVLVCLLYQCILQFQNISQLYHISLFHREHILMGSKSKTYFSNILQKNDVDYIIDKCELLHSNPRTTDHIANWGLIGHEDNSLSALTEIILTNCIYLHLTYRETKSGGWHSSSLGQICYCMSKSKMEI